jgi:hypothetical protein
LDRFAFSKSNLKVMITKKSSQDIKPRKKCFSDSSIIFGVSETDIFKLLFKNPSLALLKLLGQWIEFTTAAFANCQNTVFRYRFGLLNQGIILTFCSVGLALIANSEHSYLALGSFSLLILPFLPFIQDWDTLYSWIFVDIRSLPLLVYSCLLLLAGLVNTTMIYIGKGNPDDMSKSGESLILLGLNKLFSKIKRLTKGRLKLKANEFVVNTFIECGITASIGYYFWSVAQDQTFGLFCFLMSSAEFITQIKSKTAQLNRQAYLNAS